MKNNINEIYNSLKNEFKNLQVNLIDNVIILGDSGLKVKLTEDNKILVIDRILPRARRTNVEDIIKFLHTCQRYY